VHIVNQATVDDLSSKIGEELFASRFRPNIVLEDLAPWQEFEWVGKQIQMGDSIQATVLTRTVRCEGISLDPRDPLKELDIPSLLIEHFPEHGPYLGVYAVIDAVGRFSIGDEVQILN